MDLLNINCDTDDLFYRYKMPKLSTIIVGGRHTVISNLNEISKALNRPAEGK